MDGCDNSLDETKFRQRHVTVPKYDMIGFEIQTEDMHTLPNRASLIPWPTLTNERTKVPIQQSNFQVLSSKSCHVLISFLYTLHTVEVDLLQLL